jgi:acyl-coenzyme A synthetase/AMP-(fatty) acid ligase
VEVRRLSELEPSLDAYRRDVERFRWDVPDAFNFGRDVVDRYARQPGRPALLWRSASGAERRLDFGEMARASNRTAHLLCQLGVAAGQPLVVMLPRLPEWQIVMLGALKAGVLVIPSSTLLRPKDIAFRVGHSGAVALVTTPAGAQAVDEVHAQLPTLRHRLCVAEAEEPLPAGWTDLRAALEAMPDDAAGGRTTRASDPALVYYTSGTTGPPKAVLHDHGYTFAQRYTSIFWHGVREGDRVWTTSDTGWAKAAYGVIFGPWSLGAEVVLYHGRFEPRSEVAFLGEVDPHVFCAPPTEFRMLVKEDLSRLHAPRMRECVSAGEPLNPEVIRAWRDATGLTVRDGYGQTETILLVGNLAGVPVRPGSMGLPMPGHRVEVVGPDGSPLPPGEVGEIAVFGRPPSLFREYWKDPQATRACRLGDWYLTGDRASRDEDGYFWFVGRRDDVIISAGYRIGPFEVESALIEHEDVVEAAAVAAPDPDRGAIVKAYVVLREGTVGDDALAERLKEHVKRVTAPYKYPRAIEFVDALPKTVSGKIRRVELRERSTAAGPNRR